MQQHFQSSIYALNYAIDHLGHVIPVIYICPGIRLPNGGELNHLNVTDIVDLPHGLAVGDQLDLTVNLDDHSLTLKLLTLCPTPRRDCRITTCPVCGEPLEPTDGIGIGTCVNRACSAQATVNVKTMLMALGLNLCQPAHPILDLLLTRGAIHSILDIFNVPLAHLESPQISALDLQLFQAYVHSVRGHVALHQLLSGLRVPGWDMHTVTQIDAYWREHQWGLPDIIRLFNPALQQEIGDLPWEGWRQLIAHPVNQYVITMLSRILYI